MSKSEQICAQSECVYRDALERENESLAQMLKKSLAAQIDLEDKNGALYRQLSVVVGKQVAAEKECDHYEEVLKKISSCKSKIKGDVVYIAKEALKEFKGEG